MYGKIASEEERKEKSERNIRLGIKPPVLRGKDNPNYGKSLADHVLKASADVCSKKILKYNSSGKFIRIHNSIVEAAEELNVCSSTISSALSLRNGAKMSAGFIWKFYTHDYALQLSEKELEKYKNVHKTPVRQLRTNGEEIEIFDSIADAVRKLNLQSSNIYKVCNGKRNTTGGYIFEYVNHINKSESNNIQITLF
jgi:hypothetical protein